MAYLKKELPIGKKFNKLILLEEVPTTEKCRRYVFCLCECGSKKVLRWDRIKCGDVKSCGCLLSKKNEAQIEKMLITRRKTHDKKSVKEYIGKKFNKLTIQSIYHPKQKGRWFCVKCDCGNVFNASLTRLKNNHTKSCGCIRKQLNCIEFVSEIDQELILISGGKSNYYKTLKSGNAASNEHIHVYEAKKLFKKINKEWKPVFCVHHVDGDKFNNSLENLVVFNKNSEHHQYHHDMNSAMFKFIKQNNLLDKFYKLNPSLELETLKNLIYTSKWDSEII